MRPYLIPFAVLSAIVTPSHAYAPKDIPLTLEQISSSHSIPVYTGIVLRKETIPAFRCYRMEESQGSQYLIPRWYDESRLTVTLRIGKNEKTINADRVSYERAIPGELVTIAQSNYRNYQPMKSPQADPLDIAKLFAQSMAEAKEIEQLTARGESIAGSLINPYNQVDLSGRPLLGSHCSFEEK